MCCGNKDVNKETKIWLYEHPNNLKLRRRGGERRGNQFRIIRRNRWRIIGGNSEENGAVQAHAILGSEW